MKKILTMVIVGIVLTGCGKPVVGPAGKDGTDGKDGAVGATGAAGTNGTNGTDGKDGSSCSVKVVPANSAAPNGGSLISCGDGSTSLVLNGTNGSNGADGHDGATGATGATGAQGIAGTNGTDGKDGTVVAPIQFCGKSHGSYPSTFPEVGFCIDDEIYAVYSANGGFLTEVLPGTWSSDGINSSCTFTVKPHCVVND